MTVLFVIGVTLWLAILLMVVGLCMCAARSDAMAEAYVEQRRNRRGRFGRGRQVRMIPRTRAH